MNSSNVKIHPEWHNLLKDQFQMEYFTNLQKFLLEEKKNHTIYPADKHIFAAFDRTALSQIKVVILGQDPYHGPNQSHGLCFSVNDSIKQPPSLRNIFKELHSDLGITYPTSGNLEKWADQGVFLLNATLTVRAHQAGSHQKKGWEQFTDTVIKRISDETNNVVFLLWGNYAIAKSKLIDHEKHHILRATHPSPLSAYRGFFGCKHFSKTNEILSSLQLTPIDWSLE